MGHTPLPSRPSTPSVVHPHARGAYQLKWRFWTPYNGSSPHTWGILIEVCKTVCLERFIPTYVGHTSWCTMDWITISVHPHIRGAYSSRRDTTSPLIGSSPHTWGILQFLPNVPVNLRFIPTYVGHTIGRCTHLAGSHGSSPHTWGIQNHIGHAGNGIRFIPTYVGHTALWGGHNPHPRFIPTYVGHTVTHLYRDTPSSVHPHIRGAYRVSSCILSAASGSSPHTWGIQNQSCYTSPLKTVHPHIRGVYWSMGQMG